MLNEELLSVWLRLSGVINNQRLVTGLSFNEALVCNLLVRAARTRRQPYRQRTVCRDPHSEKPNGTPFCSLWSATA